MFEKNTDHQFSMGKTAFGMSADVYADSMAAIIEISGTTSSGKTVMAGKMAARATDLGLRVIANNAFLRETADELTLKDRQASFAQFMEHPEPDKQLVVILDDADRVNPEVFARWMTVATENAAVVVLVRHGRYFSMTCSKTRAHDFLPMKLMAVMDM